MWTLIPGVPIGCRSPRKRGPSSMPSRNHRPPNSLSRRRDVRQSPRSLSPSGDGFTWERAPRRFATTRSSAIRRASGVATRGSVTKAWIQGQIFGLAWKLAPKRHEALSIALFTAPNPLIKSKKTARVHPNVTDEIVCPKSPWSGCDKSGRPIEDCRPCPSQRRRRWPTAPRTSVVARIQIQTVAQPPRTKDRSQCRD